MVDTADFGWEAGVLAQEGEFASVQGFCFLSLSRGLPRGFVEEVAWGLGTGEVRGGNRIETCQCTQQAPCSSSWSQGCC